jgi:hypothetical protein
MLGLSYCVVSNILIVKFLKKTNVILVYLYAVLLCYRNIQYNSSNDTRCITNILLLQAVTLLNYDPPPPTTPHKKIEFWEGIKLRMSEHNCLGLQPVL